MHSAQAQSVRVKEKISLGVVGHHCSITKSLSLFPKSSPYVLIYRSMYSWENTAGYFSNVLTEILFTNSWKQSFAKLPVPKISLHNSAAFLSTAKASQRFAWKFNFQTLYWLTSLNYTLSVSEYVTTNVTAKPVAFLHETNLGCTVDSHVCNRNTPTVTRK